MHARACLRVRAYVCACAYAGRLAAAKAETQAALTKAKDVQSKFDSAREAQKGEHDKALSTNLQLEKMTAQAEDHKRRSFH